MNTTIQTQFEDIINNVLADRKACTKDNLCDIVLKNDGEATESENGLVAEFSIDNEVMEMFFVYDNKPSADFQKYKHISNDVYLFDYIQVNKNWHRLGQKSVKVDNLYIPKFFID